MYATNIHKVGCAVGSLVLLSLLLLLAGCTATIAKPQLYLLTSAMDGPVATAASSNSCASIAVSARLPAYLQREGLVLQLAENELVAADSHLWAEPLVYGVERLLNVCLNPGSAAAELSQSTKVQNVEVVVEQLHGDAMGTSRLQATWSHTSNKSGSFRYVGEANQPQPGYAALVSTQRDLLLGLCQQISTQLAHCVQ